ncbi:energy transducer TonB [Nevskia soli]|uniref:energy transducer TonB n=1 Tax=Nevskia soli TaxID=418856 RepID=UPI0004A724AB|nr:energy transducer TonB [Nevskia soli]
MALAASALFHLILLIALLIVSPENRHGGHAHPHATARALVFTLAPEPRPVVPPVPPAVARPPEQLHPLTAVPTPVPAHKQAAPPKPAAAAAQAAPQAPKVPDEVQEMEDVMGRIHDNWLEPPAVSRNFLCRIRIDYAVGGMITAVHFLQGCGNPMLDDSVRRAIWKTQPLPLLRANEAAGSLEIEFTP